jgi:hypothetical protein
LSDIEPNSFVFLSKPTEQGATVAEHMANRLGLTAEDILESLNCLIGTKEEISNDLTKRRREYGISYIIIPFSRAEEVAPQLAHLTNQ